MENRTFLQRKVGTVAIYINKGISIYPDIATSIYPDRSGQQSGQLKKKRCRVPLRSRRTDSLFGGASVAMETTKAWHCLRVPNFCISVGSKFIFLQCKKPSPIPQNAGEGRMLPMVAVRKLVEVRP